VFPVSESEKQQAIAAATRIYLSDNIAVRSVLKKAREQEERLVALIPPRYATRLA